MVSLSGNSCLIFFADFLFFSWNLKFACLDVILSPLPRGFHLAFWEEDLIVLSLYSTVAMRRKISRKSSLLSYSLLSLSYPDGLWYLVSLGGKPRLHCSFLGAYWSPNLSCLFVYIFHFCFPHHNISYMKAGIFVYICAISSAPQYLHYFVTELMNTWSLIPVCKESFVVQEAVKIINF